jgi:hypothetical protein
MRYAFWAPMRRPRYPLEPLVELRDHHVDRAAAGLAGAIAKREDAERGRGAAEAVRAAHEASARQVRAAESDALDRGELRAADLAGADAWEARVAAESTAMSSEVERARTAEERARDGERAARGDLASRRAEADVVAKDRARWVDAQGRRTEAKEEEEASEIWRPGKFP